MKLYYKVDFNGINGKNCPYGIRNKLGYINKIGSLHCDDCKYNKYDSWDNNKIYTQVNTS
jgi:hypothetical protein